MTRILIIAALGVLVGGCAGSTELSDKSFLLEPGMTKQEVLRILGQPKVNEFKGGVDEWHYCTSERMGGNDIYVSAFFVDKKLYAAKTYIDNHGGDCEDHIKGERYREPDEVREYRIKFR